MTTKANEQDSREGNTIIPPIYRRGDPAKTGEVVRIGDKSKSL